MPKIIAFAGRSGSGKSTAIQTLIRHYVAAGRTVGAIKHTHHPLNTEDRGDTGRFRRAGANPVILAGAEQAVIFSDRPARLIDYRQPDDLVAKVDADIVLIEGFASAHSWPTIEMREGEWMTPEQLIARADAAGE